MSVCRVISWVVGKAHLLWPVCYFDKTICPSSFLYSKAKLAYYSGYLLTSYFWISILCDEKDFFFFFLVLVLEGVIGLHRTSQLQLLRHQWLGHILGLLWCWTVCLGNKQIILLLLRLHPSTAFQTLLLTMRVTLLPIRDSCPH